MRFKRGIWFTSDHHFFHDNILKFTDRPYQTVEEMNEGIVSIWNSMIKPDHVVYVLGDVIWNTGDYALLKRLNGKVFLVRGNHDRSDYIKFLKNGIDLVCEETIIKIGGERVRLSHYPYRYKGFKNFYYTCKNYLRKWFRGGRLPNLSNNPRDDGKFLLHGHHHSGEIEHGNQLNVCWDLWKRPVNIQEVESWIQRNKK
jgi:calcineurin-like phosphoesterase family protein